MLVTSRKTDESIRLTVGPQGLPPGTQIDVLIVAFRGDSVRLGVSAPRSVCIDRLDALGNPQHNPRPDCDRRGAESAEEKTQNPVDNPPHERGDLRLAGAADARDVAGADGDQPVSGGPVSRVGLLAELPGAGGAL